MADKKHRRKRRKAPKIFVARNEANKYDTSIVPIILLPGIMGSRLEWYAAYKGEKSKMFRWDPDNTALFGDEFSLVNWKNYGAAEKKNIFKCLDEADLSTKTVMRYNNNLIDEDENLTLDKIDKGWGGVSYGFYGEFLSSIEDRFPQNYPVFAFGYDWRSSNRNSGKRLAARVNEILEKFVAKKCIIATHSMGGLVTRSALQSNPNLNQKVLGVIHIQQPVFGAALAYRRCFTGVDGGFVRGLDGTGVKAKIFAWVLGNNGEDFMLMLSSLDGAVQLLPNNIFPEVGGHYWLTYTTFEDQKNNTVNVSWSNNSVQDNYLSNIQPPGIIDYGNKTIKDVADQIAERVGRAAAFHNLVTKDGKALAHEYTFSIYSKGLKTDIAVNFKQVYESKLSPKRLDPTQWWVGTQGYALDTGERRRPEDGGDGTVSTHSATGLFPSQQNISPPDNWKMVASKGDKYVTDNHVRQYCLENVEHGAGANDTSVIQITALIIERFLKAFKFMSRDTEIKQ